MNPSQRGALIVSWTGVRTGREGKGLAVFAKAMQQDEELEKEGRISGTRVYLSTTGSGSGQVILDGVYRELQALLTDDDFVKGLQEAAIVCDGFEVNLCVGGAPDTLTEAMGNYSQVLSEQGLLG